MIFFPPSVARRPPALQLGYMLAILASVLVAIALTIGAGAVVFGCAAAAPACKVIDLADKACAIFRYTDPATGKVQEVRVSGDDAAAFARHVEARQAAKAAASGASPAPPAGSK